MDWSNERILLVDGDGALLEAAKKAAQEHFPCAEIDLAPGRVDALMLSEKAANVGQRYNVICWNAEHGDGAEAEVAERFSRSLGTHHLLGSLLICYRASGDPSKSSLEVALGEKSQDLGCYLRSAIWSRKIEEGIVPLLRALHGAQVGILRR